MKEEMTMKENGSALVYILIAIALLAALTASFMQPASQQTTSQNIAKTIADLNTQVDFIRSAIQECVLIYSGGDQSNPGTVLGNHPYPINPSSTYLAGQSGTDAVEFIRCPGNPGDTNDHAKIFGVMTGKSLPPAPDLFENWIYHSGVDGVFFYTRTSKSDAFLRTALERLDDNFSECEADIIDASGGAVNITSAGGSGPNCPAGSLCFRVWITAKASAADAYQTGGTEETAGCP